MNRIITLVIPLLLHFLVVSLLPDFVTASSCEPGYFTNGSGFCEPKRTYRMLCERNEECDNSDGLDFVCDQNIKRCICSPSKPAWIDNLGRCKEIRGPFTHGCPPGQYYFRNDCHTLKTFGGECKADSHCSREEYDLHCHFETGLCACTTSDGNVWYNATDKCKLPETPKNNSLVGRDSGCEPGYVKNGSSGLCERKGWFQNRCERNEDCDQSEHFVCHKDDKRCLCDTEGAEFLMWNDNLGRCEYVIGMNYWWCPKGHYLFKDRCHPKKSFGEECLARSHCNREEQHLFCNFTTGRCECIWEGKYWDGEGNKCVQNCEPGYFVNGRGICERKRWVGMDCERDEECDESERFICDSYFKYCMCNNSALEIWLDIQGKCIPAGYFESKTCPEGEYWFKESCHPKKDLGEECKADSHCKRENWTFCDFKVGRCSCTGGSVWSEELGQCVWHKETTTTPKPEVIRRGPCAIPKLRGEITYIPTRFGSRYVFPTLTTLREDSETAYASCVSIGLEPAMINSTEDLVYLEKEFTKQLNMKSVRLAIGASDKRRRSVVNDTVAGKSLLVELFPLKISDYLDIRETCIALQCEDGHCAYQNVHCSKDKDLMPLCQFKLKMPCYGDTLMARSEDYGIDYEDETLPVTELGVFGGKHYYGSKAQQSFEDARSTCENLGYELLRFTPEHFKEKDIMWNQIVNTYFLQSAIDLWQVVSWVSGIFNETEDSFTFETKEDTWDWKWIQKNEGTKGKDERCLSLFLMNTASHWGVRPVVCNMPNFFLCREK